jgi:CRP/FNR family transcriptional regulator
MARTTDPTRKIECHLCQLRNASLFRAVEDDLLKEIDCEKVTHTFRPRQVIFHEGTPPLAIYCIRSGRVKLYRNGWRGEEVVIRVLGPGAPFGYRPVLGSDLYSATAEAIEETEICVIPKQVVTELLRKSPVFALDLLARIAADLRVSEDRMLDLTQKSVRARSANLLLMFLDGAAEPADGGIRLSIPIQRKEMAQIVGTTPETFSRTLHEMAGQGIVSLTRSGIVVTDEPALRRAAEN